MGFLSLKACYRASILAQTKTWFLKDNDKMWYKIEKCMMSKGDLVNWLFATHLDRSLKPPTSPTIRATISNWQSVLGDPTLCTTTTTLETPLQVYEIAIPYLDLWAITMILNMLLFLGLFIFHQIISTTPPTLTYGCKLGTAAECKKARFVPGHTLLGEGLDIVTMKTTGSFLLNLQKVGKTCTLCSNPHVNNTLQKLPKALLDWKPQTSCSRHIVSTVSESKVSLAKEATSFVQNDWKVGLDVGVTVVNAKIAVGGSHSNLAKFVDSKSLQDKYNYLSHKLQCTYYSFHLASDAPLTAHFAQELQKLPETYDMSTKAEYRRLIRKFGTHYITLANIGGRTQEITAVRACEVTMDGLTLDEVKDCLNVEAEIAASTPEQSAALKSKVEHCKEKSKIANYENTFHQTFKERTWEVKGGKATFDLLSVVNGKTEAFENWMESLKTHPGLVSYSLDPIHNLVRFEGPQKENLRLAVGDYIKEMAIIENCSCSAPSYAIHGRDCSCMCPVTEYTSSNCCPTQRGIAKLHVTINSATGLRDDFFTKTDAYVKFQFDSADRATRTIWNNNDPFWNETFNMDFVELGDKKTFKIEVWDEDRTSGDDLLGRCEKTLTSGEWFETCYLNHGSLSYSISVTCSSYLHGQYCEGYNPVPPK
ncbi:PREDICTED: perforin-1-like [Nanorana parkeri]|uniref:perforin-1-like n=1 Tax=Nanorana parkeri TaxID=125878 RepID=UPI000854A6F4|nr:PREDICTED: perforin-1-like [Nanorana parkeri]